MRHLIKTNHNLEHPLPFQSSKSSSLKKHSTLRYAYHRIFQAPISSSLKIISSTASCTLSGVDLRSECHAGFLLSCNIYLPTRFPLVTQR
mmetsp:Transcript_5203/g.11447  ORF Transcript_5203/g.11447 Transcript_5203/m.11447 type:complete len:90 (-) Transcript_5203:218-487(-)